MALTPEIIIQTAVILGSLGGLYVRLKMDIVKGQQKDESHTEDIKEIKEDLKYTDEKLNTLTLEFHSCKACKAN